MSPLDFIDSLYEIHQVNAKRQYTARSTRKRLEKLMPTVSFIHEYFLFNSIYQVNWQESFQEGKVKNFKSEKEMQKQKSLLDFIYNKFNSNNHIGEELFYKAFSPLSILPEAKGNWTEVVPDHNITKSKGVSFFNSLSKIQSILTAMENNESEDNSFKIELYLNEDNLKYIFLLRNNIFHGTKRVGSPIGEGSDQQRRIIYYDMFLKGVTSLFFLLFSKSPVASDLVQVPIYKNFLEYAEHGSHELLYINDVWDLVIDKFIKEEDSRLIEHFNKHFKPTSGEPFEKSVLFYPSAGKDLITPIILGLPYCTDFLFYENNPYDRNNLKSTLNRIKKSLKKINGLNLNDNDWICDDYEHSLKFIYDGIERTVHWVHKDNKDFLSKNIMLKFYFHRGDSHGEGGSGQFWDSELMPKLIEKVPKGERGLFITDGNPGGLSQDLKEVSHELKLPVRCRDTARASYYLGSLFNTNHE